MNKTLALGKLPHSLLREFIQGLPISSKEILIPPGIGFDAAGLSIGDRLVSITADPVTFATTDLATYSVALNVNDIACLGCRPRWYSAVLLLPEQTTEEEARKIGQELSMQLKQYSLCAIGGHTEVTSSVKIPILIAQVIGEAIGETLLSPAEIQAGDQLLLWQSISIEGTALLAKEREKELLNYFSLSELRSMQQLLHDPGICVWPFVEKLLPQEGVVALHDPTEGGLITAVCECAEAACCGFELNYNAIPILPETKKLASLLRFDSLHFLASGSLLIACRAEIVPFIFEKFSQEPLSLIGEFTTSPDKVIIREGEKETVSFFEGDAVIGALKAEI